MRKITLILAVFISLTSQATTKDYMHVAFDSLMSLNPYLAQEKKFLDPKEEEIIYTHIDNLSKAFSGVHGENLLKGLNYAPSLKVIRTHIDETKIAFNAKQKYFARNRLRATQMLCMNCHSQMKNKASTTIISEMRAHSKKFTNDFDKAETLYLLRDYPTSVRYYKKYIDLELEKSQKIKDRANIEFLPERNILLAFKRIVHLYTKTFFKPEKALTILELYNSRKDLPETVRESLRKWKKELIVWKKDKKISSMTSVAQIEKAYLSKMNDSIESDRSDITLLVASGRILQLLNINKNNGEAPLALYWLGFSDRQLNFSYYYSMAEIYLVDCMERFPKHPVAKRCLAEYRSSIEMGYTGSSGQHIPKDLRDKIRKYEQLIGK
ncbi:MAG: hypothetical protein BM556_04030 [Bacteriovorax sp. MedPE-SWde]|nr:MAG: hypothetical protein BM556_04030 [Bacteriovorax sp. MedPE-SWde]